VIRRGKNFEEDIKDFRSALNNLDDASLYHEYQLINNAKVVTTNDEMIDVIVDEYERLGRI
jgi:selenophosphate synthase